MWPDGLNRFDGLWNMTPYRVHEEENHLCEGLSDFEPFSPLDNFDSIELHFSPLRLLSDENNEIPLEGFHDSSRPFSFNASFVDFQHLEEEGRSKQFFSSPSITPPSSDNETSSSSNSFNLNPSSLSSSLLEDDTTTTFPHPLPEEKEPLANNHRRRMIGASQNQEFIKVTDPAPYSIPIQVRTKTRQGMHHTSRICTKGISRIYALHALFSLKLPSSRLEWISKDDWKTLDPRKHRPIVKPISLIDNVLTLKINKLYYVLIHYCVNRGFKNESSSEPVDTRSSFRWWSDKKGCCLDISNRNVGESVEMQIALPPSICNHSYIKHLAEQDDLSPLMNEINTFFQKILAKFKNDDLDEIAARGFDDRKIRINLPEQMSNLEEVLESIEHELLEEYDRKWIIELVVASIG